MMELRLKASSKKNGQFVVLIDKPTKTPLSTLKQHGKSHGVSGGPGLDVDVCQFEQRCMQAIQPPTLLFNQSATHVYQLTALDSKRSSHRPS